MEPNWCQGIDDKLQLVTYRPVSTVCVMGCSYGYPVKSIYQSESSS
jgi:hypothetical protein